MERPRVALHDDLLTAFYKIPRGKQKKVGEFISKFRSNPRASGINYEKINDATNPDYRSVRIDDDYRGIVLKPETGNVYMLLWVDKHDDAYDWARRVKCEVNPDTGTLQIYETIHTDSDEFDAAGQAPAAVEAHPLFTLRERELRRLGVPEDRLELIQSLTSLEALEQVRTKLPLEAFEALSFLAEGMPKEEVLETYGQPDQPVDTADYEAALERDTTKRRFRVVEDEMELQQMLEAPLERWRVFLHPDQRALVERDWNGPVRVLGGAGTGKTVVAMHRAAWLVRNRLKPGERLLFTTFTRNLATDIETNLRKLCSSDEMKQIEVTNIDAWVVRFLKREKYPVDITYPGMKPFDDCWRRAIQLADGALDLPESFYLEEWRQVILPQRVQTRQDYFRARRIGRGVPLTRKQRAHIWPVFEEMRLQLHQRRLMTVEDGVFAVLDMIEEGAVTRPYQAAVVDEAQDLGSEALLLIRKLVEEGRNDLMLVGDGHQRIYGRKTAFSHSGINIKGRGRKLRINYRTTEQIRRMATAVLENVEIDDLDGGTDPATDYRSLVFGNEPVVKGFDSEAEEAEWIAAEIGRLLEEGFETRDICVVGRTGIEPKRAGKALAAKGIETLEISRDSGDDQARAGVRLANMHRVKGLEFKIVFLIGIRDGRVPLEVAMKSTEDPVEKRNRDLNERALLHVAGTRAAQSLYVTWSEAPSRLLG